jgi:hypothetical protein
VVWLHRGARRGDSAPLSRGYAPRLLHRAPRPTAFHADRDLLVTAHAPGLVTGSQQVRIAPACGARMRVVPAGGTRTLRATDASWRRAAYLRAWDAGARGRSAEEAWRVAPRQRGRATLPTRSLVPAGSRRVSAQPTEPSARASATTNPRPTAQHAASSSAANLRERVANQLRRRLRAAIRVERRTHGFLGLGQRVA